VGTKVGLNVTHNGNEVKRNEVRQLMKTSGDGSSTPISQKLEKGNEVKPWPTTAIKDHNKRGGTSHRWKKPPEGQLLFTDATWGKKPKQSTYDLEEKTPQTLVTIGQEGVTKRRRRLRVARTGKRTLLLSK